MSDYDWQYDRQTRRPAEPRIRIGDAMTPVPNRNRPLTGPECDEWQYRMAVGYLWDGAAPSPRRLWCWHCQGNHLTHECREVRT